MPDTLENILIIKPSSLGDIVLALPALTALRESFPNANISWLIRPEFAPLVQGHPHLNDTIHFDRKFLGKAWFHPRAFASLLDFITLLRRRKFDAVVDLQGLFRTASLAWLTRCKRRLGMANARELGYLFYTHKIPQDKNCVHLVDHYLKIVRAAGASEGRATFVLPSHSGAAESVKTLLNEQGLDSDNYVVLVPSSSHTDKCWPVEKFALLADKISSQFGLSIIATGTHAEKPVVDRLSRLADAPVANLAGRTTLPQLVALLKAAKLVVSNDTGPGHIAAALDMPLVIVFGRSNPARVAPYDRSDCAVAIEPDARGLRIKSKNPQHDVRHITVDDVFEKVCLQIKP
jgi:lipopolysaccharide heptosyltransferase I